MLSAHLMLVVTLAGALAPPLTALAQAPRMVRIDVQFQHTGTQSDEEVHGRGGVIITERGSVRPRGRIGAGSTQTQARQ